MTSQGSEWEGYRSRPKMQLDVNYNAPPDVCYLLHEGKPRESALAANASEKDRESRDEDTLASARTQLSSGMSESLVGAKETNMLDTACLHLVLGKFGSREDFPDYS
ncbi:hypothetical protein TEQG_04948 [Trichophyton equinum CBS 127.97]|uniref:Uncharacterized protein n=1 Tax=Trichophyton equinum (strain ATCC MYA-4606 / CBS 127.97) TaxID=559882 RepID=F2PVM3_TRIEC|nr:hypothetical protein TEQG_04948 [Trichophyton equinum CBS 127.97]